MSYKKMLGNAQTVGRGTLKRMVGNREYSAISVLTVPTHFSHHADVAKNSKRYLRNTSGADRV